MVKIFVPVVTLLFVHEIVKLVGVTGVDVGVFVGVGVDVDVFVGVDVLVGVGVGTVLQRT
jgi:hypothetical protein